ncbi:DMT family transporter [Priestia megaterium]|uniref:DMT family transporter n=1 Tax=Priestia megaterium TaxID=1404 RepID=UPI002A6A8D7D|nr:EamA family transporter [Priestia megaterium]MDY0940985.1 EamA family transporter [Priestia megaterium]
MVIINYVLICFIFGTTFLTIKLGIEAGMPPLFSAGARFLLAGILVISYFAHKREVRRSLLFSKKVMAVGFCLTFMTFLTLYWAEQHVTSGLAAVLSATGPMMILLIQVMQKKMELKKEQAFSLLLAFTGVICISLPNMTATMSYLWTLGCIIIIIGEVFYGIGSNYSKSLLNELKEVSPFLINGIQMFYGGVFLLVLSSFTERINVSNIMHWNAVWSIVYLIFVGSIAGHGLYYWLIAQTNPVFPSTWLYVAPLIAVLIGHVFLNEAVMPSIIGGGLLILIGVFMANRATLRLYLKKGMLFKKQM